MITSKRFNEIVSSFPDLEKRGSFYDMAMDLLNKKLEVEAYILILATWNFAYFRYSVKDFDINGLKEKNKELSCCFEKLEGQECRSINFDEHKGSIKRIYETLFSINGIGFRSSYATRLRSNSLKDSVMVWFLGTHYFLPGVKSVKTMDDANKKNGWNFILCL